MEPEELADVLDLVGLSRTCRKCLHPSEEVWLTPSGELAWMCLHCGAVGTQAAVF